MFLNLWILTQLSSLPIYSVVARSTQEKNVLTRPHPPSRYTEDFLSAGLSTSLASSVKLGKLTLLRKWKSYSHDYLSTTRQEISKAAAEQHSSSVTVSLALSVSMHISSKNGLRFSKPRFLNNERNNESLSSNVTKKPIHNGRVEAPVAPPLALILISSCNSFLAVFALTLNTILVLHYKKHLTNIPSLLYFRNGLCDIISAIGFLLQVPSVISILKEHTSTILPLLSFWISTVSVRMSVFMNCLLGVVRCINILSPFYLINKKIITLSTSLYLLIWTSIASLDVWVYITKITLQNRVYLVKSLVLKAEAGFSLTSLTGSGGAALTSLSQGEIVLVQFLTPLVLPALLCFVLMVFQILHLRKQSFAVTPRISRGVEKQGSNKEKDLKQRTNKRKNKAATSILIVTIIYVLTSTVSVAMWLVIYRDHLGGGEKIKKLSWSELSVIYFSTSTLPLLCSTLTPLTLLVRGDILKSYTRDIIKKILEFSTRRGETIEMKAEQ